jgi:hypothetical protein
LNTCSVLLASLATADLRVTRAGQVCRECEAARAREELLVILVVVVGVVGVVVTREELQ